VKKTAGGTKVDISAMKNFIIISISIALIWSCNPSENVADLDSFSRSKQNEWNRILTKSVVQDIFSPVVAARIYAYPNLAAYEVLALDNPDYLSLFGQINGLQALPNPENKNQIYLPYVANLVFSGIARQLVINENLLKTFEDQYKSDILTAGLSNNLATESEKYAAVLIDHFMDYIRKDNYTETRSLPRYMVNDDPARWSPTPPPYMDALEPHWAKIRSFTLDSPDQFRPSEPYMYDTSPNSALMQDAREIYELSKTITDEQEAIALFWDCNPNQTYNVGHVMLFKQQLSPGGHWISITDIASDQVNASLMDRAEAFALTSMVLHDAFISCWEAKYHFNFLRPVHLIRKYFDPTWEPLLETPAFPEHTSGHSVISRAAAEVLTRLFGDGFAFEDTSELDFGYPARHFSSFIEASNEAAMSRRLGGIHFKPAIEVGINQGKQVADHFLNKVKTRASQNSGE
jgi:hypothetical protein